MSLPTVEEFRKAMVMYLGRLRGGLKSLGRQPTPAEGLEALAVVIPVAEACRGNKRLTADYLKATNSDPEDPVPLIENCLCYDNLLTPPPGPIPWDRLLARAYQKQKDWTKYVEEGIV